MKRAALSLLFVCLLAACGGPPPNLDSPGHTIVCLGDSITAGVGAAPEESYPARLAERLGRPVVNAGVSGDTAADGLSRVPDVLAQDPWLGDRRAGGQRSLAPGADRGDRDPLRAVVERLLAAKVVPVLVEVRGPFGHRYRDLFARLHHDYKAPLVDGVLGDILTDPSLKSDEVHPNAAGYRKLAEGVAEKIEPLITKRTKMGR
ncbi:MAG TPA: GDSL-type esterase/lipase family protein [Thermoanaerobaculia bacterium]|nr:GDSL-type esterase/lipase family protein [Thermoanaerobaculia bacterium]